MRSSKHAPSAILLTATYVVVVGLGMRFHEMWRDELEIFAKIRDNGLAEVLSAQFDTNVYFYALYAFVKSFASSPVAFQAFHLAVAASAVFVFARFSPFTRTQKVLFAFGYFPLFEYGIISREYAFGCLLTWIALALITRERRNYVAVALALVLLANHGLFSAFVSIGLTAYLALDLAASARASGLPSALRRRLAFALGLFVAGWALQIWKYYVLATTRSGQFGSVEPAPFSWILRAVWNAYVPLHDFSNAHFWNTNILPFAPVLTPGADVSLQTADVVAVLLSLALLLVAAVLFSARPAILAAFAVATALHLLFLDFISVLNVRYAGFLFVAFVACCWLRVGEGGLKRRERAIRPLLTALLAVQLVAGSYAYVGDLASPFSASAATADYIRQQGLDDRPMIGLLDYVAAPVAVRLEREIYFPQTRTSGSYVDWRNEAGREELPSFNDVLADAVSRLRGDGRTVLLILSFEIQAVAGGPLQTMTVEPGIGLRRLAAFEHSVVADEVYYLYELHRQ